jgi:hypothetical protein
MVSDPRAEMLSGVASSLGVVVAAVVWACCAGACATYWDCLTSRTATRAIRIMSKTAIPSRSVLVPGTTAAPPPGTSIPHSKHPTLPRAPTPALVTPEGVRAFAKYASFYHRPLDLWDQGYRDFSHRPLINVL